MSKQNIVIIDYNIGNIQSISGAFRFLGANVTLSRKEDVILAADAVILPGVGAFTHAMETLEEFSLSSIIKKFVETGKPIMGICLGMQILFSESEEFGRTKGLNLISGKVIKFPFDSESGIKLPNVGWNELYSPYKEKWKGTIFDSIKEGSNCYFVHSYVCVPDNVDYILTESQYNNFRYCSSVQKDNIYGCQFHPEKSSRVGLNIINNFLKKSNIRRLS